MVDHKLIVDLELKSEDFAIRWKSLVRKASQLKHYNSMSDEELIEIQASVFSVLAKTIDRGTDRSLVGGYFVGIGKDRMKAGYPVSEVIYALSLAQRVIIEYVMTEFAPQSPVKMYQSMGIMSQITEFFFLGCFYLTKGFLEAVYTKMNIHDSVEEELLKKYFKDDFFFKKE